MNRTVKKILLLSGIVAVITICVLGFISQLAGQPQGKMEPTNLSEYIKKESENGIKDKDYKDAYSEFSRLKEIIKTEDAIKKNNGIKLHPSETIEECKASIYNDFGEIFANYVDEFFRRSHWDEEEMKNMQKVANEIAACSPEKNKNDKVEAQIKRVEKNNKDYATAKGTIARAKFCRSVNEVEKINKDVKTLNSNNDLKNEETTIRKLSDAENDAKQSCAECIYKKAERVLQNRCSYGSYYAYTIERNKVFEEIENFKKKGWVYQKLDKIKRDIMNDDPYGVCY